MTKHSDAREFARSMGDRWVMAREEARDNLPLILHLTCYEYMGQPVKIIQANVYDTVDNAEIVVESSSGDAAQDCQSGDTATVQSLRSIRRELSGSFQLKGCQPRAECKTKRSRTVRNARRVTQSRMNFDGVQWIQRAGGR